MSEYDEFERELAQLTQKIKNYNLHVNKSGVWLFLATLGCWGVSEPSVRYVAIFCVLLIFSHQFWSGIDGFKPFSMTLNGIKKKINESGMDIKSQKALLLDISELNKTQLSFSRIFIHVPAYYISIIFFVFSIAHW